MSMSKSDYERVARVFAQAFAKKQILHRERELLAWMMAMLVHEFEQDNPNFKASTFIRACEPL